MSSHSDRFPSSAGPPPDDDSGVTPSADQSPEAGEPALSEAEQRQLRLDAIKRAIDEGVYDHEDLFDRALRRMIDHEDLADDSESSEQM